MLQAVVDSGGYAQAAEKLHRSQSSVSYTIARLQEQVGVPLLVIEGRKAQLTETGTALLRRSRRLVDDALELEKLAGNLADGWEPEVRLVVDAAFPVDSLMSALKMFAPISRGTRVQLQEVVLSGAEEALEDGSADLAVGAEVPAGFLGDALLEIEFVAVAHAEHPLHHLGRAVTANDLRREIQVVIRDSGLYRKKDVGWLGAEYRWTVTSIDTAVTTVCSGLGFGWLPRHQIREAVSRGIVKALPMRAGGVRKAYLYLIFGRREKVGPATQQLAESLRRAVGGDPGLV
ncbi:MAG: transcriptional regulator [Gammaproteobacteria bacterium]|nr:MAG: transcriptional regulator [Gammaproteobacteria bacterium]TND04397.1 MAG: transcriptional regulator [Gammaproteobacteria bacterium]